MKRTSSASGGSRADDRRRPLRSWAAWPIGSSRDGASFERIHAQAVRRRVGPSRSALVGRIVLTQAAALLLLVAGISVLLGEGGGLYWLVAGEPQR